MSRKIDRILAYCQRTPWAILPSAGALISGILGRRAAGRKITRKAVAALTAEGRASVHAHAVAAAALGRSAGRGVVAVVPVVGTIVHRGGDMASGTASTQALIAQLQQLDNDPNVRAVVLDIDSPGGTVDGVQEAADAMRALSVPVVAVANSMAASAAYWLAAQADEIVITPSGEVGSVGVYSMHADMSKALEIEGLDVTIVSKGKHKTEGNPFEPLGDEAKAEMQAHVDEAYAQFVADVAKGRGVSPSAVRSGYGEGRMVRGKAAVKAGMADRVATLEATVERLAGGARVRKRRDVAAHIAAGDELVQDMRVVSEDADTRTSEPVGKPVWVEASTENPDHDPPPAPVSDLDFRRRRLRYVSRDRA